MRCPIWIKLNCGRGWTSGRAPSPKLRAAYLALVDGGVKSYVIDDRELTRFDLPDLKDEIEDAEKKVDELLAELNGRKPRKAFGIVPRDW